MCFIELSDLWDGASLDVISFDTVGGLDVLFVNDVGYSGAFGEFNEIMPDGYSGYADSSELQGLIPVTTIMWTTDGYTTSSGGWKTCRKVAEVVEWSNWTCTVSGDDCTDNCTTQFSDPSDEDSDGLVHDGHPWCTAPTGLGYDGQVPCGPCNCLAGEAQTYESRVFRDDWASYEYVVCTPCGLGTFKSSAGSGAEDLCSLCSSGKYAGIHRATGCDTCAPGRFEVSYGSSHCAECGAGHFTAEEGATVCEMCAAGRFAASAGSSHCAKCGAGHFTAEESSSVCDMCAAGRFGASAGSSHCAECGAGRFTAEESSSVCEICAAGRFEASNGSSHCPPCAEGYFSVEGGATVCEMCAAGRVAVSNGSSHCALCDAGYFSAEEGASVCDLCAAGYWSLSDGTACEACGPGHFAPWGAGSCQQCTAGHFSATNNSSTCVNCGIGRFANGSGMENCHGCYEVMSPRGANPQLWTTMREELRDGSVVLVYAAGAVTREECGCDQGAWMSLDSQCYECGEGVLCNGMGKVIVMEGYFAPSDNAGDVWMCHGIRKRCPGGDPGTCAENRDNTSLACGECLVGTRPTTSGACEECGSGQPLLMVLAALSLLVGLCIVYFLIATENRARQKDSAALIAIIVSQVVTAIQVLGILNLLSVQWPEPFASILAMSSLLHFNLDVLSPNCVMSTPALMSYCMSLFAFVLLLTVLILIHFVSVIVFFRARFFLRDARRSNRQPCEMCGFKRRRCVRASVALEPVRHARRRSPTSTLPKLAENIW